MPDITSRGAVTDDTLPRAQGNGLSLDDAVTVVKTVMLNQFKAFDKVYAALDAAQQAEAGLAAKKNELDGLNSAIMAAQRDLAAAQDARKAALNAAKLAKQKADADMYDAQAAFQASLDKKREEFEAQLQVQAAKAKADLEDSISDLRNQQQVLSSSVQQAKVELDAALKSRDTVLLDLKAAQDKLDAANLALDALKAKL